MPHVLTSLEKWMIMIEMLETEEIKALEVVDLSGWTNDLLSPQSNISSASYRWCIVEVRKI